MPAKHISHPHTIPSQAEQAHIQQALDASQTAMDAIGTVTNIASFTLTILGVIIAIVALWGVALIVRGAREAAKQIANERLDGYIQGEDFRALVVEGIDAAVKAKWQDGLIRRLEEAVRGGDDPSPFPVKDSGA